MKGVYQKRFCVVSKLYQQTLAHFSNALVNMSKNAWGSAYLEHTCGSPSECDIEHCTWLVSIFLKSVYVTLFGRVKFIAQCCCCIYLLYAIFTVLVFMYTPPQLCVVTIDKKLSLQANISLNINTANKIIGENWSFTCSFRHNRLASINTITMYLYLYLYY